MHSKSSLKNPIKDGDQFNIQNNSRSSQPTSSSSFQSPSRGQQPASPALSTSSVRSVSTSTSSSLNVYGVCWLTPPTESWDPTYYFTLRGAENFHIYLWCAKDLCWMQLWYWPGMIFGASAVTWSAYLILFHAMKDRNYWEQILGVGQFLWLFANYWWMTGELHDSEYPNEASIYNMRTHQAGDILRSALIFVGVFVLLLKPCNLLEPTQDSLNKYDRQGLKCRFSYFFRSWRDYENIHIFFWLGKDVAWNDLLAPMWLVFVVPTVLIAVDFVFTSLFNKYSIIDHAHYAAVFCWVCGNMVWAAGEIFYPAYDAALPLSSHDAIARKTCRWYSSWIMISSFLPLAILYIIWLCSSVYSGCTNRDIEYGVYDENDHTLYPKIAKMDDKFSRSNPITINNHRSKVAKAAEPTYGISKSLSQGGTSM